MVLSRTADLFSCPLFLSLIVSMVGPLLDADAPVGIRTHNSHKMEMAPEQRQHEVGEGGIIDALNIHYIYRVLLLSSSSISMLESFACHSSLFSKK